MLKRYSRSMLMAVVVLVIVALLAFAFWPRPVPVDIGTVVREAMEDTITEEGRTRVHDAYVVSTPVAGRLRRVEVEPGDAVVRGEDIVAYMAPSNPAVLDVRTREQARANVSAAEAALRLAQAERNRAVADLELADSELERQQTLRDSGVVSEAAFDRALRERRAASAAVDTADAAVSVRMAELQNARIMLQGMDDSESATATMVDDIPIQAPATGRVLRVIQQSESTLPAGTPILEIGNVENDLEVLVELLSTDAVQVRAGQSVRIADWGGAEVIDGVVERVEPWGFTKYSALGVEEQRVNTIIRFNDPADRPGGLGHGYRVVTEIVIWEEDDVLVVPSSALFRDGENWAVYAVRDGRARPVSVEIDRNNGLQAHILSGLAEGDQVVLYPSSAISDGVSVAARHAVAR
ncbi:HlyD family efflux transporter periplasmic adaptor subunit [Hyphobacterium sp. HN65]|uniref:HlyD family efflux transporter periplasmic adaptor subunit n=1 Tax=Hyphobacterium lacteum TaxID=3116575 RepID=A0ABU7LUS9_9PROT|nr:HlyD family efflux transporter periplasmic adaptor subunit [Hyphobacterium sp. HN65]MEE2527371.1 HlyD family efflux transporter periplasmic adaptor subunit [Hyphobacterium sp. HN65]